MSRMHTTTSQIDCDGALLLASASVERELSDSERTSLERHAAACERCRDGALDPELDDEWLSVVRIPIRHVGSRPPETGDERGRRSEDDPTRSGDDALDTLPTVDPSIYRYGEVIGRGGMGRVLSAWDRRLGRPVAIKELLTGAMEHRFEAEARITARLQHPAIVNIHEAGRWPSGEPFYTMKLVEGAPLSEVIKERETLEQRIELIPHVMTMVDAVAYAHSEGVIHRDLKPANVIVGPFGETVVIDWGLAKNLSDVGREADGPFRGLVDGTTQAGLGTPQYMPPEQARGEEPDERVDVYALGATLYHVLNGEPPYGYGKAMEILDRIQAAPPLPIASLQPAVPRDLGAIVDKAMARDPDDRYPDATALAEDLRRFQAGQLVGAADYTPWQLVKRWLARHRTIVAAAGFALAVAAVTAAVSIRQILDERANALAAERLARHERASAMLEQGRRELLAGTPMRALPYLVEALRAEPTGYTRLLVGEAMRTVDAHAGALWVAAAADAVALDPEGRRVAVAAGKRARIYTLDGALLAELVGHTEKITSIAWSRDARRLVTTSLDNTARRWRATGKLEATFHEHGNAVRIAAVDNDGRVVSFGDDGAVREWRADGEIGSVLHRLPDRDALTMGARRWHHLDLDGQRTTIALPRDYFFDGAVVGRRWAAFFREHEISIRERATGKLRVTLSHSAAVRAMIFAPDGDRLIAGDASGELRVWSLPDGVLLGAARAHRGSITSLGLDQTGARLVSGDSNGAVRVWNVDRLIRVRPIATGSLRGAKVAVHERLVAAPGQNARVVLLGGGRPVSLGACAGGGCAATALAFSPDGRRLAACDSRGVRVLAVADGSQISRRDGFSQAVTFSRDGSLVASAHGEVVALWRADDGRELARLQGHTSLVTAVAFTESDHRILTASRDGTLRVWRRADGQQIAVLGGHEGGIEELVVSRRLVATAGFDGTVHVWTIDGASDAIVPRLVIQAHRQPIHSLRMSADGRLAVSASYDGTAKVWSLEDGKLVLNVRGVGAVALSGNGKRLALSRQPSGARSGERGHEVELWDLEAAVPLVRIPGQPAVSYLGFTKAELVVGHASDPPNATDAVALWTVPFEGRGAEELAREHAELAAWRLVEGRLVATHRLSKTTEGRLGTSVAERNYDFYGQNVEGSRARAAMTAPAGSKLADLYSQAWQAFNRGEYVRAHRRLREVARAWPRPLPEEYGAEYARFAAWAQVPVDGAIDHLRTHSPGQHERRIAWLGHLVEAYAGAGRIDDAKAVTNVMLASSARGRRGGVHMLRRRLAEIEHDPERAVAEVVKASKLEADPAARAALDELATIHHRVYSDTFDARHGRAALAAYAALTSLGSSTNLAERSRELRRQMAAPGQIGSVGRRVLRRGIQRRISQVADCYNRVIQTQPIAEGTLTLELFINDRGETSDVRLTPVPGKRGVAAVARCVKQSVRRWSFPRPRNGRTTCVRYPFVLRLATDRHAAAKR